MDYQITLHEAPEAEIREYMRDLGISRILASCLINREISIGTAETILNLDYEGLNRPLQIKNIEAAAQLIKTYLEKPKSIIQIFGDYDTDGVTSTAIACKALYKLAKITGSKADAWYTIPERKDGYGISQEFAEEFKEIARREPDTEFLVMTVDNGITLGPVVTSLQQEPNIRVLVTDHHEPDFEHGLTPVNECLCVDPYLETNSEGMLLAGCGVIFNVLRQVEDLYGLDHSITDSLYYLAAIGTIGDMMSIDVYHACLIQAGLAQLNAHPSLLWVDEIKRLTHTPLFTAKDIAFTLAPIINSCGQMGHASWAIRMLMSTDEEEIRQITDKIHTEYKLNKEATKELKARAEEEIETDYLGKHLFILYPLHTDHPGLTSKVATHLGKTLGVPIILWAETEENKEEELIAGSARNDTAIPVLQIVREAVSAGLVQSAEGHKYAFGVKLYRSKLKELQEFLDYKVQEYVNRTGGLKPVIKHLDVDCVISTSEISVANMLDIAKIPFAKNLEAPVVMIRGAFIKNVHASKNNPKNLCYTIQSPGAARAVDIWAWNIKPDQYKEGQHTKADLVGTIERNFMKPDYATLNVIDVRTY